MEPSNRPPIIHLADCVSRRPYFPCLAKIYLTTSLLKLLSKHLITLRNISFQLVHFDCSSQHHISFRFGHFRMSHPSMSLSKGLPQSQRVPRVEPPNFSSGCIHHTSMNRRGTYISVTRRRQRRNSQSQRRTSVL